MSATAPEEIWALRMHEPGGSDRLIYEEVDVPSPTIGDVLVRVHAASFTPTELAWPATSFDRSGRDRRPTIPGHEVSGSVVDLGFGTTGFVPGDEVMGITDWYRDGAAAEYVAVEARNLTHRPEAASHVESAAVPLAGLTAWQALFIHGGLTSGQRVLILGAGGGVGTLTVQLARMAGGHVVGAGRQSARELVLELGAHEFIDVDRSKLEELHPVDLVIDLVGGELLERSSSTVMASGRMVSVVEPSAPEVAQRAGVRAVYFIVEPDRAQLGELGRLIDTGELRPLVGKAFDLADGTEGFKVKRGGGVRGKAVLRVITDR
jgi:NADPH:quinone reductase-like Zn-dependent oxidoreductase